MKMLRLKGIVPFIIFFLLVYLGSIYWLDSFLKRKLAKSASRLNGALVEIADLNISFRNSRVNIRGIQVTDPENLMRNRFEVGETSLDFQFLPLLKKKVVIEEVKVAEVRPFTERQRPGRIPARWQRQWQQDSETASMLGDAIEELKKQVVAQLPPLALEQLGDRFDPRKLVDLQALETYQRANALPNEFKEFGKEWQQRTREFVAAQRKKIDTYKQQIATLDPKKIKTPQAAIEAIQTIQTFQQEIGAQKNSVENLVKETKEAVQVNVQKVTDLKKDFESDIDTLKKKISFGDLELGRVSQSIFGGYVIQHYGQFLQHYSRMKLWYDKWKAAGDEDEKPERHGGRFVHFPVTDRTPKFLLQKVDLSARIEQGRFAAKAAAITTQPQLLGKPTTFTLSAELQEGPFSRAELNGLVDRTTQQNLDEFQATLSGLRLGKTTLGPQSFAPLALKQGRVDLQGKVSIATDQIDARVDGDFHKLSYDNVKRASHPLVEIIYDVIQTIRKFQVGVSLQGELRRPKLRISSTFDQAIKQGVEKVLLAKIKAAQAKLEAYLRAEVGKKITAAQSLIEEKRQQLFAELNKHLNVVQNLEALANKRIQELKNQQTELLKQKVLPDKLKLPGKDNKDVKKLLDKLGL